MCSKIGRRRPQKLRLRPVHSRSNRNPLDLIERSWMPRRQIMRQTSMRCIDSAGQPAAVPMGRTDSGNTLRRQTGDEIGRDAGVVSVNMTDENVLAD